VGRLIAANVFYRLLKTNAELREPIIPSFLRSLPRFRARDCKQNLARWYTLDKMSHRVVGGNVLFPGRIHQLSRSGVVRVEVILRVRMGAAPHDALGLPPHFVSF
jgi:hypothetical protein